MKTNKIICFDFDDTMDIKTDPYPAIGKENTLMLDVIKTHVARGDTVILNTMREGKVLQEALDWLKDHGITPDAVNDNCESQKNKWNNNPRKISCDINYDDKNFDWGSDYMNNKLQEFVKKEYMLKELEKCEKDRKVEIGSETYGTGYRNGYHKGRAELIRYILDMPEEHRAKEAIENGN